jgi:hypothetical protein
MRFRAFLAAITLLVLPRAAGACTCAPKEPPCSEYWKASAVFRGRVEAIERAAPAADDSLRSRTITFTVLEAFSGVNGRSTIRITTAGGTAACGVVFGVGREYVVYASPGPGGMLSTTACSGTTAIEKAAADLAYARGLAAGTTLGRISGRVVLRYRDLARGRDVERPMGGLDLTLRTAEERVLVRTDRAGAFSADGLQAGAYDLELHSPEGARLKSTLERIRLADARGCSVFKASVIPQGRVTGRVVDAQRRPVAGLTLELAASSALGAGAPRAERLQTTTTRDGTYEFAGVPPGRFVAGINTREEPEAVTRVLHPGVADVARAMSFALPAGGAIDLGDLVVPNGVEIAQVTGFVFDVYGAPVENARVFLRGPNERDFIIGQPVTTDFMGRFVIAAAANREYRLFAERPRPGDARGRTDASSLVAVITASSAPPLKLQLRRP